MESNDSEEEQSEGDKQPIVSEFAAAKSIFAIMSDDSDEDITNMQSLSAARPGISNDSTPGKGDDAFGVGDGDDLADFKNNMAVVTNSAESSASSATSPPPPPDDPLGETIDDTNYRSSAVSSSKDRNAFYDSVSHGIIRSAAAAAAGNLPESATGQDNEELSKTEENEDAAAPTKFIEKINIQSVDENMTDGLTSDAHNHRPDDSVIDPSVEGEFAAVAKMIRNTVEQSAESCSDAHNLLRVTSREGGSGSVNFAPSMAAMAAAISHGEGPKALGRSLHVTAPPTVDALQPQPPLPNGPQPHQSRKLEAFYKRAALAVKRGDTTDTFRAATNACAKLRRRERGHDAIDRDLYDIAGLDPNTADAPTLSEMRRLCRQEAAAPEGSCTWSLMEQVAFEVLGLPLLKEWYDSGVRNGQVTRDRLISQYQAEVNRLVENAAKEKQVKKQTNQDAHVEAAISMENRAAQLLVRQSPDSKGPHPHDSAAQLAAELKAQSTIAALSDELHVARARQRELEKEISGQRRSRKELEMRVAGLDEAAMVREDSLLLVERANWARERDRLVATVSELHQKLSWYAENQTLLDTQLDANRKQRETINSLKLQVRGLVHGEEAEVDGSLQNLCTGGNSVASKQVLAQKNKRIRLLELQLKRLQQQHERGPAGKSSRNGGHSRGTDSIAALIEASRPNEAAEEALRKVRAEKTSLETELETVRQESSLAMRSLKQQFTKLQVQYKEVSDTIEASNKRVSSPKGTQQSSRQDKVKLAEAEVKIDQLQRALAKRSQYMEQRIEQEKERCAKQIRAMKMQLDRRRRSDGNAYEYGVGECKPGEAREVGAPLLKSRDNVGLSSGDVIASDKKDPEALEQALREVLNEKNALEQDLRFAVSALEEERRKRFGPFGRNREGVTNDDGVKGRPGGDPKRDSFDDVLSAEVTRLRLELEKAMMERNEAQKATEEATERLREENQAHSLIVDELKKKMLTPPVPASDEKQLEDLRRELDQSKELLVQTQARLRVASTAEARALQSATEAENRAALMQKNLQNGGATASVVNRHRELEKRLHALEARVVEREAETTRIVQVARKQGNVELMRLRALHSNEISAFREELDALLGTLTLLAARKD